MKSFYSVLLSEMKRKKRTREEYETIIATWILNGLLTLQEARLLVENLDELYPQEDPEPTA